MSFKQLKTSDISAVRHQILEQQHFKCAICGKRHSEETLAKIRSNPNISHKKENHPLWGTHCSEETNEK